jgi:hypothetical protein
MERAHVGLQGTGPAIANARRSARRFDEDFRKLALEALRAAWPCAASKGLNEAICQCRKFSDVSVSRRVRHVGDVALDHSSGTGQPVVPTNEQAAENAEQENHPEPYVHHAPPMPGHRTCLLHRLATRGRAFSARLCLVAPQAGAADGRQANAWRASLLVGRMLVVVAAFGQAAA